MVRRPGEVFLAEGEDPTLRKMGVARDPTAAYIPFGPGKDPRDLKLLDPACGSGHFLLYGFDLLIVIYREAWEDEVGPGIGSHREDAPRGLPDAG